jgi:hypothetical protein
MLRQEGMQNPQPDFEADESRRLLLEESDQVLEKVEQLRLAEARAVPASLRRAIAVLQARLGRQEPPPPPATLRAAHSMVFAVQQRLMAANPRNPGTRAHPGRAAGAPRMQAVRAGARWKVLTLPPRPAAGDPGLWLELADATVERALERWAYAQFHAVRAARENGQAGLELAVARVAWANYFELRSEAARLRLSLSGQRPAAPAARRL